MGFRQGLVAGFTVTQDTLVDLCDLYMEVVDWNLRDLSLDLREIKDCN